MSRNLPQRVLLRSCALLSHSGRTLPRHIWFLARLITSNNVHTAAQHPSRAPFTCSDSIPGHNGVKEGEKGLLYAGAPRRRIDDTGGTGEMEQQNIEFMIECGEPNVKKITKLRVEKQQRHVFIIVKTSAYIQTLLLLHSLILWIHSPSCIT